MSISAKGSLRMLAAAAALALPAIAMAGTSTSRTFSADDLTLQAPAPTAQSSQQNNQDIKESATVRPQYMADAAETPNIHGFLNIPFKSAYVTPRGLVVENQGLVIQPIVGLVFPIGDLGPFKDTAIVTGIWSDFNTAQGDPKVGCWNEVDYFLSFSGKIGDDISFTATYSPWFFPQSTVGKPDTEHTADLKVSYSDHWFTDFSINPYVDFFWSIGGSSNVVFGDQGDTGYVELGIVPTKVIKVSSDMPLTFTFPTYFSVGPEGYWDTDGSHDGGNFGLFSISANVSLPITAIPVKYGHWHLDLGVTYDYLINDALLDAGNFGTGAGNDNRNVFVAGVGIGVNF
ncbi:MAG TPA: hypothetical protein VHD56_02225 [Tepidisphaeraceae bacterium]|nr:hypothetical protein [Tepidisphaeraceae bacterium]